MKYFKFSNQGKRKVNQDYVLIENINPDTFLLLIADGMGGYEKGEVASKLIAENISTFLSTCKNINTYDIQKGVNKANLSIKQLIADSDLKTGATVGGVIFSKQEALCFWIGDVKIFHFKNNKLKFESNSHTLMNEIIKNGSISNIDNILKYKHIVTRSIHGDLDKSKIETKIIENITEEDLFLVCSDGVHDILDGIQIEQILNSTELLNDSVNKIEKRLEIDSKDNFSLIFSHI